MFTVITLNDSFAICVHQEVENFYFIVSKFKEKSGDKKIEILGLCKSFKLEITSGKLIKEIVLLHPTPFNTSTLDKDNKKNLIDRVYQFIEIAKNLGFTVKVENAPEGSLDFNILKENGEKEYSNEDKASAIISKEVKSILESFKANEDFAKHID